MNDTLKIIFAFFLLFNTIYSQSINDDLIGYFPFSNNADDSSTFFNQGTVSGAILTSDRFGNENSAYEFDGIDDFIIYPFIEEYNLDYPFTITAWIKPYSFAEFGSTIVSKSTQYGFQYGMLINGNTLTFNHIGMGFINTEAKLNNWSFLCISATDSLNVLYYLNNQYAVSDYDDVFALNFVSDLYIGANSRDTNSYFHGKIDDVRIYNRSLSVDEIVELKNYPRVYLLDKLYDDYLLPSDTTISTSDSITIYGRLGIPGVTEEPGKATDYTAKINLSLGSDPRLNWDYEINGFFDKDVDGRDQYKTIIKDIPEGAYRFCYMYYRNDILKYAGGVENEQNYFYPGKLNITNPTSIEENISFISDRYELQQNYPNPFNPTTTISYSIPKQSAVSLKLFNVLGKEVKTLVNEVKLSGNYKLEFDASSLPSGVYFYRLQSGKFSVTKKLMLLR